MKNKVSGAASLLVILVFVGCENPFGSSSKSDDTFHPGISTASPTLSSVSPSSGSLTGGTSLTLTGTNFVSGATVLIGTSACLNVNFVSATQITCTTPARSNGLVSVTVTNPDSQVATLASAFEYSASSAGGTSYAVLSGGGISTGGGIKLQGSAGEQGTPFYQSGTGVRVQSGIQGVLHSP